MSTPVLVALNVLNVLTGGSTVMAKHRAPESRSSSRNNYTAVPAPRCPHGHFVRWARKNCKDCNR